MRLQLLGVDSRGRSDYDRECRSNSYLAPSLALLIESRKARASQTTASEA